MRFTLENSKNPSHMARTVSPPYDELNHLRQPLTAGERRVLDWFDEILPTSWEIYIQPHLNGLRPDFVLLNPQGGIAVYEVKDWNLSSMDYFVRMDCRTGRPRLMARRDGKEFLLESQNPVSKVQLYKEEIYNLYAPSLPTRRGFGLICAGVIFTNATTAQTEELLAPLRENIISKNLGKLYPVIGSDLLQMTKAELSRNRNRVLFSAFAVDQEMNKTIAGEMRNWLVEPSFSAEQRVPLSKMMTKQQQALTINKEGVRYRRVKGPAGSGKSLVLAGRAAELAKAGKRVLLVTFNITLINYLLDMVVQYAQSGKVRDQITALNFHTWCSRLATDTGHQAEYHQLWEDHPANEVLSERLPKAARNWAAMLDESDRYDAILVDEGQDFMPSWWLALRAALSSQSQEALLVADAHQNIYDVKPWTEQEMEGSGFRGQWMMLDKSFRLSPKLCEAATRFVESFLPGVEAYKPESPVGEFQFSTHLQWLQLKPDENIAAHCVDALLGILEHATISPIAIADLVCIVDREAIGRDIVKILFEKKIRTLHTFGDGETDEDRDRDGRRKKLAFYKGDARVKVTTIHSFKGWESKAMVLQIGSASTSKDLALAYAGITRLKRDDRGCHLTVVCSAPELKGYGSTWSAAGG